MQLKEGPTARSWHTLTPIRYRPPPDAPQALKGKQTTQPTIQVAELDDALLLLGGKDGGKDVWVFHYDKLPQPDDGDTTSDVEPTLVVVGGVHLGEFVDTVSILDVLTGMWSTLAQSPSLQRSCHISYDGLWERGLRHGGDGVVTYSNDAKLKGAWVDNVLQSSTIVIESYVDRDGKIIGLYEGAVDDSALHAPHGPGMCMAFDGTVYMGEWKNGKRNGIGTCDYAKTRDRYEGKWVGDVRCGLVKLDLLTSISSSPPPQPLTPALTPPASRWHLGLIENYTIIDKVGSGTYGEVYKCQHKITKDIVALKKLRQDVEKNGFPVTSIREMKILKQLKHPNIVELKEIVSKPDLPKDGKKPPLYFAFEYMEHDLSGLLTHEKVPKFSRTQIQCYMRQLLYGIAFMHGQKIMHRDIKASNLLLNNAGMLKIADFGLSRFWTEANARSGRYTNKVVTLWYRPPELLMGCTAYDYSIDMWSVGCIFAELLLGKAPLQGRNELEQ
ncbi:hypothetical protein DYB31_010719, partial [Aphanomyces astaci]